MSKKLLLATLRENAEKVKTAKYLVGRLQEMGEAMYPETMEMGAELEAEASPEEQVAEGLKTALNAILDMDISPEDMLAKIKMLLEVKAEMSGEGKPAPEPDPALQEAVNTLSTEVERLKAENVKLQESVTKAEAAASGIKAKADVEAALRAAKREVTDVRVSTLLAVQESARQTIIETWPEMSAKPAVSKGRYQEGRDGNQDEGLGEGVDLRKILNVGKRGK